jgi:hypothetical protein
MSGSRSHPHGQQGAAEGPQHREADLKWQQGVRGDHQAVTWRHRVITPLAVHSRTVENSDDIEAGDRSFKRKGRRLQRPLPHRALWAAGQGHAVGRGGGQDGSRWSSRPAF